MSQAVPGYPAHPDILSAFVEAAGTVDATRYGKVEGDEALRTAYAAHVSKMYDANVLSKEIVITSGCNQAFIASALAVAEPGDDILVTRPTYFNHDSALGMLGLGVRYVDCYTENAMLPRIEDLEAAIGPKTRAIALVRDISDVFYFERFMTYHHLSPPPPPQPPPHVNLIIINMHSNRFHRTIRQGLCILLHYLMKYLIYAKARVFG